MQACHRQVYPDSSPWLRGTRTKLLTLTQLAGPNCDTCSVSFICQIHGPVPSLTKFQHIGDHSNPRTSSYHPSETTPSPETTPTLYLPLPPPSLYHRPLPPPWGLLQLSLYHPSTCIPAIVTVTINCSPVAITQVIFSSTTIVDCLYYLSWLFRDKMWVMRNHSLHRFFCAGGLCTWLTKYMPACKFHTVKKVSERSVNGDHDQKDRIISYVDSY